MRIGAIFVLTLVFQLAASSSPEDCAVDLFKEDEQTSINKCLDGVYESCSDRSKEPKNCTQLIIYNNTNGTLSSVQNCTPHLGNADRCRKFVETIQQNALAYYFLVERYEEKISYYEQLKDFMSSYILDELASLVDDDHFSKTMSLFCRSLNFKAKACQNLRSFCQLNSGKPFCRHSSFSAAIDYMECFEDPKYLHADCEDICNVTQTKKYFGFDGINQSRCDALNVRCTNVSSVLLVQRCEKRLKLAEICLVENNETYAPCEAAVRSMSITYDALDYTLRKHRCFSPLICFQYLKQIVLQMKMSWFMHDHCQLQGPPEYFGEICHIMGEFCFNTDLRVGDDGKSSCGDWMKYPKEVVEIVETTPQFNGWTLIFVMGQIVVMAGGAWAGARPYLDNVQIKMAKLKGEQKKRAEEIQKKRNHFTERDICVNFHRLVFIQDALYFGFIVYESFCTNDCTYSMFFIGMWAAIFTRTYKTAKHLNKGLKANWEKSLWTHGRQEYSTADTTCIILSWFLAILVWRKYARFDKLFDYRFWPVFVALCMAFGFSTVKITIRWLLPLSVDRIVVDKPRVPPKERRRVLRNIQNFLALPFYETDKAVLRKRKIAQKKGDELAMEEKAMRRVKTHKKPSMGKKSKESKDSNGSTSLSAFCRWLTRHNTTTVVNEQKEPKSSKVQMKMASKPKKHNKNGKKGKTAKIAPSKVNAPKLKNGQEVNKKDKKLAKDMDSRTTAPAKKVNSQKVPAKENKAPAKEKKKNNPTKKLDQGKPPSKDQASAAKIKKDTKKQLALPQLPKEAKNVNKKK